MAASAKPDSSLVHRANLNIAAAVVTRLGAGASDSMIANVINDVRASHPVSELASAGSMSGVLSAVDTAIARATEINRPINLTDIRGDRRGVVAVDFRGEVYAVARWAGIPTKAVRARFGDGAMLRPVAEVRAQMVARLGEKLTGFADEATLEFDPDTGRMLTNSKDFVRLSEWAEAYERERGRIWCGLRVENNARRAKGDFVRASSPTPRSMEQAFDQARGSNDNVARRVRDEAKARTAKLASDSAAMTKRHGVEWDVLRKTYKDRKDDITARSKQAGTRIRKVIGDSYTPAWRDLYRQQFRERRSFNERETRVAGKIANAMEAIRHRRDIDPENSRGWMSAAFAFITSKAARVKAIETIHAREKAKLKRTQRQATDRAMTEVRQSRKGFLARALDTFGIEREALIARQAAEKDEMKAR